jgi:hypothetical protein
MLKFQGGEVQVRVGGVVAMLLLALACSEPNANATAPGIGDSGAGGEATVPGNSAAGGVGAPVTVEKSFGFDFFSPQSLLGGEGEGGAAGESSVVLGPPYGASTECGDAIVGDDEECDDGAGGEDACSAGCQTRDQPAGAAEDDPLLANDRYLGAGRHPLAGLEDGFISTYMEEDEDGATVAATLFDIWGRPAHRVTVSDGAAPIYEANPVAAALPGGKYAVAWNDFDGDGSDLGVALRRVDDDGMLGPLRTANGVTEFSQLNPDMIWTDTQLVVAWEDHTDPFNGPDLRVRTFDQDLNPASEDVVLADSSLPEAAVALAPFAGGWAAAYREGTADGQEVVVVRAVNKTFRIGPVLGGPLDDRPALVALDETQLFVAFSVQTDPSTTGIYDISRIRFAVVDVAGSLTPTSQSLDPLDDLYTRDAFVSQLSPSVAAGTDGVYLAWRSEARPGDAAGDQLWLKTLRWSATSVPQLEARNAEMLLPRTCDGSTGDQRRPALAPVALPPHGALAVAWNDYSHAQGLGDPDVVVHYAPMHPQDLQAGSLFEEDWKASDGTGWTSHWSTSTTNPAVTASLLAEAGKVAGTAVGELNAWVNHHTAVNVEMTATVDYSGTAVSPGFIARLSDDDPDTYVGVRLSASPSDPWRVVAALDGQPVTLPAVAAPAYFSVYAPLGLNRMRFRVTDDPDGVRILAKTWVLGIDEPETWNIQTTLPIVGDGAAADLGRRLYGRPGRFGLHTKVLAANYSASYDDFRARFFEGSYAGDVTSDIVADLPLRRANATYQTCTPDGPCVVAQGCCNDDSECAPDLRCSAPEGDDFGFGSHAKTCSPEHCSDGKRNADETHADCGGADCAACDCTSTRLPGQALYCSPSCPCGVGDADCHTPDDCLPGLLCGQERGYMFGWAAGTDVCIPAHCYDYVDNGDEEDIDCGGSCGSCDCTPLTGCQAWCPCGRGEGDCDYNAHCDTGLGCGAGAAFGQPFNVCTPTHCLNNKKDTALGETSIDAGGPCGSDTGITLAEAMADFPTLQYRPVTYALETADFMALPTPTPLTGSTVTPVLKHTNRFIFTVPATAAISMTFTVSDTAAPPSSAIDLKVFNTLGSTLKTAVLPSNAATTVLLGTLGAGTYELDLAPRDASLTYTVTRSASTTTAMALKNGAALNGPVAPLYFFVPVELDTAFLLANFDASTPVQFWDPSGAAVTPIVVSSKVYAIDTHGKHGVWKTSFRTSSLRAHLVNLPDVLSFDPGAVVTSKIIRTGLDYGPAPTAAVTSQYLRYDNRFVFHVAATSSPVFNIVVENSAISTPLEVWVQRLNGEHLPNSPFSLAPTATYPLDVGVLAPGDYELRIPTPAPTTRYQVVTPAGVPLISVDGFNSGNVWLASYRDYFYVPAGVSTVRFASPTPSSIFVIYDPSGTAVANQPVSLGNGVYEIQNTTPGTWAMNVKGATSIRFLNIVQHIGFDPGIEATPLPSPPYSCTSNANCAVNEVCGTNNGARFGRPASDDLCWQPSCASSPPAGLCGSVLSPCGTCP